jgi:hypothetical protein
MKLEPGALAIASGATALILWAVCSLLVIALPGMMMNMTGDMMHADMGGMSWSMGVSGFIIGLVLWTLLAALTGWLIATIYNRYSSQ